MTKATPKQAEPRLEIDRTRERLTKLGLDRAAELLDSRLVAAANTDAPAHRLLDELLREELESREERRIRTSLRLSGLPTGMTLEEFDFSFQPSIERSRIETLAACSWIKAQESVLLQGPPGVGKTHLAAALGVRAIQVGFSVAFYRFEELLAALRRDAESAPAQLRRRKYVNASLLIIDEMGFEPMDRLAASLVFRLVSYRYGRGSVLITTNKGIGDWPQLFAGDEVLATAVLDRLLHRAHLLNIKGRSYRLRDLEESLEPSR